MNARNTKVKNFVIKKKQPKGNLNQFLKLAMKYMRRKGKCRDEFKRISDSFSTLKP